MAIKVNLLPRQTAPARPGFAVTAPRLTITGGPLIQAGVAVLVVVILGLGAMGYMAWNARAAYAREVTSLRARNEALKRQLTELRVAEDAKREIQRRLEIIGRVARSQGVPVATMNGVLKAVPTGIWLTAFDMKPQEVKTRVDGSRSGGAAGETLERLAEKKQEAGAAAPAAGGRPSETREVLQLQGYAILIKGIAYNNYEIADFMENLRKGGLFADVDFTITQIDRVEQTRVMSFEVTASVKL